MPNIRKEKNDIETFKREFLQTERTLKLLYKAWQELEDQIKVKDENGAYASSLETAYIGERLILQLRDLATYPNEIKK